MHATVLDPAREAYLAGMARQLRRHVVRMTAAAGSGHPGGSLSAADIVAVLYFDVLRLRPEEPDWPERDRFILCKGHAAPVLYAALAERGFFPVEDLLTLRQLHSHLQGHPDMRKTPGVEASTGSLGHGLSIASGLALGARLQGHTYRVYALLGDGECQEGNTWEAALAAPRRGLDNLTAFVDYNRMQNDGHMADILPLDPLADKWRAFGWHVLEIDGHDIAQIRAAVDEAQRTRGRPTVVIAHTIKGKGVSFMENNPEWHGKGPNAEELARALAELE
ncbi:MAG: transketolase [Clostridia bacterium]|nr:transketolase [Clostridia bacterium]